MILCFNNFLYMNIYNEYTRENLTFLHMLNVDVNELFFSLIPCCFDISINCISNGK